VGEKTGKNPTDRGKRGTKRSLLTDGAGVPLALAVDGANRHDKKLVSRTLNNLMAPRPSHTKQHMCMDKGYDYPDIRELVDFWGYTAHIASRGVQRDQRRKIPGYRARRWVVERTHSWFNRFRRLLVRWEKNTDNYVAMLHLACAFITFRAAGVMG
jgi:putative transposase